MVKSFPNHKIQWFSNRMLIWAAAQKENGRDIMTQEAKKRQNDRTGERVITNLNHLSGPRLGYYSIG